MTSYYTQRLSAERLAQCYELASPRMQRYLAQEIKHLIGRVRPGETVLELGCGYGRVALPLAQAGCIVLGIDVAEDSAHVADFKAWARALGVEALIEEVDGSSLWCELHKPQAQYSSTGAASSHRSQGDTRP